jgi:hypothetical protein
VNSTPAECGGGWRLRARTLTKMVGDESRVMGKDYGPVRYYLCSGGSLTLIFKQLLRCVKREL